MVLPNTEGQPVLRPFQKLTFASHLPYFSGLCSLCITTALHVFWGRGLQALGAQCAPPFKGQDTFTICKPCLFPFLRLPTKTLSASSRKGYIPATPCIFATNRSAQPGRRNIRRGSRSEATDCRTLKTGLDIMVKRLFGPVYTPEGRRVSLTWNTGFHFSCDSSDEEPSVECMGGTVVLYCMM